MLAYRMLIRDIETFPHQESDWPESNKVLAHNFKGVPADEVHKMTIGNAVEFFRLP